MRYFLIAILLIGNTTAWSQNIYGSPYSIYGLGMKNDRMSTLNRSMGGTGIAVRDELNLNYMNPASYGSIMSPVSSIFEMGFYIEYNHQRTTELSESKTSGSITNLNYWFKLRPKWASTVGLTPYSTVSYKINTTRSLGGGSDIDYTYEGTGTISQLYWGHSFNILKKLSIGFNLSYLFGSIVKGESLYGDPTGNLIFENKIFANTITMDAGLQYEIGLNKNRSFVIGVIADKGAKLNASQKNYLHNGMLDTLRKSSDEELKYSVPGSFGLGLALHSKRYILAGDVTFANWSEAVSPDKNMAFEDTWKWSVGYVYKGNPDAGNFLGSVSLRAGAYVEDYYLKVKTNSLPRWGLTAGISIPVFDNRSSINLTYSFNHFGTLENGSILQRSQQIMVDIIVRDLWGMRRKFD